MEPISSGALAALIGLAAGGLLGFSARMGRFCTLGALETAVYGGDQLRLRIWGVVLAVAIAGTYAASAAGWVNIGATMYHANAWNPLASILGGLIFGLGMALAGNCGFGALVRFGGGDLRSLVIVVVMGVFAFVSLSGPLAPMRVALFPQEPALGPQGIADSFQAWTGIPPLVSALAIAGAFLAWGLSYAPLREQRAEIGWGVMVGVSVVGALIGTSWLYDRTLGEIQPEALSFTAPIGRTILYVMTSTAGGLSFSVGAVSGVLGGALAGSLWRGRFRWEACDDPRELGRQVGGAALMGIGGTLAMGCSVGQGVSAFATLAWSAPVTLAAIVVGGLVGLRQLIGAEA